MSAPLITKTEAGVIADAPDGFVEGLLKLAARGLNAESIRAYARAINNGDDAPALPMPRGPKHLTIQCHSFLHDPRQWSDTYNLSSADIESLRGQLVVDPEGARTSLTSLITSTPRVKASGRAVRVVLDGLPGAAPSSAQPLANVGQVNKALASEMASNSAVYGAYSFEPVETRLDLAHKYQVDLGQNLFVLSHSKKSAIAAARIVSVKGRTDPSVVSSITYVARSGKMLFGADIDEGVWNCIRGPRDKREASARQPLMAPPDKGSPKKHGAQSEAGMTTIKE
jgi:hypothetical protein